MLKASLFLSRKFLFAATMLVLPSCQTIDSVREKKATDQKDLLETQMSIVINYLNKSQPQKAHGELRTLMETNPDNADLINLLGLTQLALKNTKVAEAQFRRSLKIEYKPSTSLNLSSALLEQGKYSEATRVLAAMKKANDYKFPERISHNQGLAWERSGKPLTATRHYQQALSENPNHYPTLMQLAKLYQRRKMDKAARVHFSKAAKACPTCVEPAKLLSISLFSVGKTKQAVAVLENFAKNKDISHGEREEAVNLSKKFATASPAPVVR